MLATITYTILLAVIYTGKKMSITNGNALRKTPKLSKKQD
jgi:hypothetical protein